MTINITLTFNNMGTLFAVSLLHGDRKYNDVHQYIRSQQFHRTLTWFHAEQILDFDSL